MLYYFTEISPSKHIIPLSFTGARICYMNNSYSFFIRLCNEKYIFQNLMNVMKSKLNLIQFNCPTIGW